MTKTSRTTALLAVFVVAVASLGVTACGVGSNRGSEGGEGEPLTVGSDIPYPPFEQGKPGHYTGFDIELIEAIGERIGRTPEVKDASFETIFDELPHGEFETVVSAATISPAREKSAAFSNPYYLSDQAVLVKEGSPIESLKGLDGKAVGVLQGRAGQELANRELSGVEIRPYPNGADAVDALKAGAVEGVLVDAAVAQNAVETSGGVEIAEKVPTGERFGIAVAQGNTELLDEINLGLKEVEEDGTYAKIYRRWFHTEPPKAIFSASREPE